MAFSFNRNQFQGRTTGVDRNFFNPAFGNNYEFAQIDLDADGFLDVVTINDGPDRGEGFTEHIFRNDAGTFVDATDQWWPAEANIGWDDATPVPLDIDSDGDADFLITSLDGPDRLLLNDGSVAVTLMTDVFQSERFTAGTLAIVLADLDGDRRLDAVEAQGEAPGSDEDHVYFGTDVLAPDTAPPIIRTDLPASPTGETVVHARVHDNDAAYAAHAWQSIEVRWDGGSATGPALSTARNAPRALSRPPDRTLPASESTGSTPSSSACLTKCEIKPGLAPWVRSAVGPWGKRLRSASVFSRSA